MLLAYDADGNVLGGLTVLVKYHPETGDLLGMEDFADDEANGRPHMPDPNDPEPWQIGHGSWTIGPSDGSPNPVKGSKVWPEWLGSRAAEFRVELSGKPGQKHIGALVHKETGHRRERAAIEVAIEAVAPEGGKRDVRHLVGGPDRPLNIDKQVGRAARGPRLLGKTAPGATQSPKT
jgi:hypothetical protein